MTTMAILITVLVVELNFRIIEKPLRNYGRKVASKFTDENKNTLKPFS
jgi:hypothetical protein